MNGSDVADTYTYGRKLVEAGFNGIRAGETAALNGRTITEVAAESAPTAMAMAAAGASVALLTSLVMQKRGRSANAWLYGAVGTAVGIVAGLGWKSRKIAASLAHSAMKEMSRVSDEHWLERNPIDYA